MTSCAGSNGCRNMRRACSRAPPPVVLAGDYNVMPTELDVYAPERWVDDALFRPEVREAFRRLTGQGWTDALRALHPNERIYTFWKYFRNAFAGDAGLRIDHLLLSPADCQSPGRGRGRSCSAGPRACQRPRARLDRDCGDEEGPAALGTTGGRERTSIIICRQAGLLPRRRLLSSR